MQSPPCNSFGYEYFFIPSEHHGNNANLDSENKSFTNGVLDSDIESKSKSFSE